MTVIAFLLPIGWFLTIFMTSRLIYLAKRKSFRDQFENLYGLWQGRIGSRSKVSEINSYPEYLEIIAMGTEVVPLISEKMRWNPDHWFVALEAILGKSPANPDGLDENNHSDMEPLTNLWLKFLEDRNEDEYS